ncbi:uncharacterized protein isoform X2 [Rhodnius prolixus]|uniref:Uncharacterized protein n=1 Tax=Rhodnius prolixus TaxID=13249 RepID=T1HHW4_RHOPR
MQKKHSKRSSQKPVDLGMIDPKALEDNIGRMSLSSKDEDEEETPKESPSFKKLSTAAKGIKSVHAQVRSPKTTDPSKYRDNNCPGKLNQIDALLDSIENEIALIKTMLMSANDKNERFSDRMSSLKFQINKMSQNFKNFKRKSKPKSTEIDIN